MNARSSLPPYTMPVTQLTDDLVMTIFDSTKEKKPISGFVQFLQVIRDGTSQRQDGSNEAPSIRISDGTCYHDVLVMAKAFHAFFDQFSPKPNDIFQI